MKSMELDARDLLVVRTDSRDRSDALIDNLTFNNYAWNRRTIAAVRLAKVYPRGDKYEARFQEEVAAGKRLPGFGDAPAAA